MPHARTARKKYPRPVIVSRNPVALSSAGGTSGRPEGAWPSPGLYHQVDGRIYRQCGEIQRDVGGKPRLFVQLSSICAGCGSSFDLEAPIGAFREGLPQHCDRCAARMAKSPTLKDLLA